MAGATGPVPDDPSKPAPSEDGGGRQCRSAVGLALRAFLDLLDGAAIDGKVSVEAARRIAQAVMGAQGPLAEFYARTERDCEAAFTLRRIESQRSDHLGRLITQPFSHLFDDPASGIERKVLPRFFSALRMMLGEDAHEELKNRCNAILETHRGPDKLLSWASFFADPEAQLIFERVLVTMARSFRRFEPRRDWFLIVMNSNPSSVSLGSNAFIPRKAEDKAQREFTEAHMCKMFNLLFESVRPATFDDERRAGFVERWGVEPEKVFGPLFVELQKMCG